MVIDVIAAIIILVSTLIAFVRGFVREVLTIAGVVGGLVAAYNGAPYLTPLMEGWLGVDPKAEEPQKLLDIVPYPIVAQILSYGAVFIVVVIFLSIASHFLAETIRSIGLGAVDRTMGILFGLARGVLLLGLLYLPVYLSVDDEKADEWFAGSKSHFYMKLTSHALADFLPESAKESIDKKVNEAAEKTQEQVKEKAQEGARGALERMDLLNPKGQDQPPAAGGSGQPQAPAPAKPSKQGYTKEFREEMDELFKSETGAQPKTDQQ